MRGIRGTGDRYRRAISQLDLSLNARTDGLRLWLRSNEDGDGRNEVENEDENVETVEGIAIVVGFKSAEVQVAAFSGNCGACLACLDLGCGTCVRWSQLCHLVILPLSTFTFFPLFT